METDEVMMKAAMTSEESKKKIGENDPGMTFQDERTNDGFAAMLVNISNGEFPDILDKKHNGLIFVNCGFGGKKL